MVYLLFQNTPSKKLSRKLRYRNGNALPAAHAIDTGAAASNLVSQAFSALVTVPCNAPQATINVKALSATSVRIANIIVVKIA